MCYVNKASWKNTNQKVNKEMQELQELRIPVQGEEIRVCIKKKITVQGEILWEKIFAAGVNQ